MSEKETSISDIKKEIKRQVRQKKKGQRLYYSFLGFVEDKDLSKEVETLFREVTPGGYTYYNWVHGNEKMGALIQTIEEEGKIRCV